MAGLAGLCQNGSPAEGDPFEIIMAAKRPDFEGECGREDLNL